MATLTVYKTTTTGGSPTFAAADVAGDEFVNSGKDVLIVKNGGVSSITVTVNSQQPCNYGFDHDLTVTIPAGEERWVGPLSKSRFNDSSGKVQISYSAVTSVTVAVVEVA